MDSLSGASHGLVLPVPRRITAALLGALLLIAAGCTGSGDESRESEPPPHGDSLSTAATAENESLPRLVDLGADKCVPCKMMAPILEELKETFEGRLDVQFIDVWKDPAPGREFGVKVIPTQIFFDEHGNELFRHQGFMSREDILAKWAELGYEFDG